VDTGILMLAAGFSRRFGTDKRLAALADGTSLLEASVQSAVDSGLPVVVCLRPGDEALAAAVRERGAAVCFCAGAAGGMGATLAEGMRAVRDREGVLVALGDMPEVRPETYRQVAAALARAPICRPLWQGRPGHPVGFSRRFFPALQRLAGDRGARDVLREHRDCVLELPLEDAGVLRDIDSPDDLD